MAKQKAQIPIRPFSSLPEDVREAIVAAKNALRTGLPGQKKVFENRPPILPNPADGCQYFEFDVGAARPGDPVSARGKRRLIVEVVESSRQPREIYFTASHYLAGSVTRIR